MKSSFFIQWPILILALFLNTYSVHSADFESNSSNANSSRASLSDSAENNRIEDKIANVKSLRPNQGDGPTRINFAIFLLDIDTINAASQNFAANVFLRMSWKDPRLALEGGGDAIRRFPLEDIWNPEIILTNRAGVIFRSLPEMAQVAEDGTVTYRQRLSGMLSQPLNLAQFPMDKHTFTIQFASTVYKPEEVEFVPAQVAGADGSTIIGASMAEILSVPDWNILSYEGVSQTYQPIDAIKLAGFAMNFTAERYVIYFYWQILLPLIVVVVMSWTAFWVQQSQPGVRISVSTSSILTLIAHRFIVASLLPRLPYMTRIDYFSVGSTLLVFIALILVVASTHLNSRGHETLANKIDHSARIGFPLAFLILVSWFLFL